MKLNFIYPTLKNSLTLFIGFQTIPLFFFFQKNMTFLSWLLLEIIGLGILLLWPLKPIAEMDEREIAVELKWKSRMFESMAVCVFIPVFILLMKPETKGWLILNSLTFPAFALLVILSVLKRKELGSFFAS